MTLNLDSNSKLSQVQTRLFCMSLLTLLVACTHPALKTQATGKDLPKTAMQSRSLMDWRPQSFVAHKDWIGMNIDWSPIEDLRLQLESLGGVPLKTRGEAHITVITPPEFSKLAKVISVDQLTALVEASHLQEARWKPICVAYAQDPKETKRVVYFLLVESTELLNLRRQISEFFTKNGGTKADFNPNRYYPHITIGFSERDLFESDGIIKDTKYCSFDLTNAKGEKITSWNQ